MTNQPRKPTSRVSVNHAATGGPLPSFRALLENGKVSRWRLSIGALLHGLAVSMLLLLPLAMTEQIKYEPPGGTIVVFPVAKGSPEGTQTQGPRQVTPHDHKPTPSDLLTYHVQEPETPKTEGGPPFITAGPDIDVELPFGRPDGQEGGGPFGPPGSGGPSVDVPVPQPPTPAQPVEVGGRVREPRLVRRIEPTYPRLAKQAGIEGQVELKALLDVNGRVTHIEVKRGHPALISAATNAVSQWVYEPTYLNDRPVAVMLKVVVEFRLRN
jgi:protein TonB